MVVIINAEALPTEPALLAPEGNRFAPNLFSRNPQDANLLEVSKAEKQSPWADVAQRDRMLRERLADLVVIVPDDLTGQIETGKAGNLEYVYNSADDQGQMTFGKVQSVVEQWKQQILSKRLKADSKTAEYTQPVTTQVRDIATKKESSAIVWSRIVPFILVLMSLTGAFYPAIDLCAGEKERGTMETLLISPARRAEIVCAKFITVLTSSLVTAATNLLSITLTGWKLLSDLSSAATKGGPNAEMMSSISLPSAWIMLIVFLMLVPIAAFLSAICLSLAVMAKSMKEGQYYLTPVFMVAFPLTYMTLVPGVELSPVYSLLPLTGTCLLLKTLLAGRLDQALPYMLPVLLPTLAYTWIALRWAVAQFESESVLFREAERFDLKSWVAWNIRNKTESPSADQATLGFVLILLAGWFIAPLIPQAMGLSDKITPMAMIVTQVVIIAMPSFLLALLLCKSPMKVLRLKKPIDSRYLLLGLLLPLALHPMVTVVFQIVETNMPMAEPIKKLFGSLLADAPLWMSLAAVALAPGFCEELAFRGWVLSGLRTANRYWTAIIISSVLFGVIHVLLSAYQQFFHATLLGLVLGLLALRSGSLWPGVIMHITNNAMAVLFGAWATASPATAGWLFRDVKSLYYHWPFVVVSLIATFVLLRWTMKLPSAECESDELPVKEGLPVPGAILE
jgi:sodium transport system permease protein